MTAKDTGYAPERWAFDEEVTRVFDDMLARSVPAYGQMRSMVTDLARGVRDDGRVLDLGCSRGGAIASLAAARPDLFFFGVETSPPMLDAARARFDRDPRVCILEGDLRDGLPEIATDAIDVALCVLTLMFVPVEHRLRLLDETRRVLRPGGRLLLVEKVLGETHAINERLVDRYEAMKLAAGYSEEDVARKRLALEGKLVPLRASENARLLADAGFDADVFWACLNFRGWIAVAR